MQQKTDRLAAGEVGYGSKTAWPRERRREEISRRLQRQPKKAIASLRAQSPPIKVEPGLGESTPTTMHLGCALALVLWARTGQT